MMYLQKSFTVPAAPRTITACERCVYGTGRHGWFCEMKTCRNCGRETWPNGIQNKLWCVCGACKCRFCGDIALLDRWGYCQGCNEGMARTNGD